MRARNFIALALLVIGTAAIAAKPAPPAVHVERAWIRWLPANLPAAGYAVIVNDGDTVARLASASSPDYRMVMLHHSRLAQGDSTMEPVAHLDIPAHGSIRLAPGGYHLMLSHATRTIEPGDAVTVILAFAGGATLPVVFHVLPANATGPAH